MEQKNNENLKTNVLELDGKVYEMKLTHPVLKRVSARTKIPMSRIEELMDRYDYMSVLVEEMLRRVDPMLSDNRITELLDSVPIMTLATVTAQAFSDAFPQDDDTDTEPSEAEDGVPFGTGTNP